ncbi:hypothetical protein SDC9_124692 [bioreactor metagenome]|uniref:Uncharacterized protein n=1 Tax=bioreactor metagenome TaxID=1076179 RepID=A0A645CL67_9ZZZZ
MQLAAGFVSGGDDGNDHVRPRVRLCFLENIRHERGGEAALAVVRRNIDRKLHGRLVCFLFAIGAQAAVSCDAPVDLRHRERMVVHIVVVKPNLPFGEGARVEIQRRNPVDHFVIIDLEQFRQVFLLRSPNPHAFSLLSISTIFGLLYYIGTASFCKQKTSLFEKSFLNHHYY